MIIVLKKGKHVEKKLNKNVKIFLYALAVLFAAYSIFLNYYFTSDHVKASLTASQPSPPGSFRAYLAAGRMTAFFYARISYVLGKIGITIFHNRNFYWAVILLAFAAAFTILYKIFEKYVQTQENKCWLFVTLMLSFVNPYIIEIFVYMGWEVAIGVLITVLAVWTFTKSKYIATGILLMLGLGTYRSFFSIFLIFATTWLFLEYKQLNRKAFWTKAVLAFGIAGLTAVLTIALTNLNTPKVEIVNEEQTQLEAQIEAGVEVYEHKTVSAETLNEVPLFFRCKKLFWKYYYTTITEMGLLPKCFLLISMLVFGGIVFAILIKKKEKIGRKILFLVWFALINLYPVSIYFLTPYYDVFSRIVWPIFGSLAVVTALPFCLSEMNSKWGIVYKIGIVGSCAVIIYSTTTAASNFFIANSLDLQNVMQVQSAIEHYEAETGIHVTKIAARRNERSLESYPQIDTGYYNYAHKSMYDEWCDVELLNAWMDTDYEEISMDKEMYYELFGDTIWTTFNSDEQLIFDKDTLYWAVY